MYWIHFQQGKCRVWYYGSTDDKPTMTNTFHKDKKNRNENNNMPCIIRLMLKFWARAMFNVTVHFVYVNIAHVIFQSLAHSHSTRHKNTTNSKHTASFHVTQLRLVSQSPDTECVSILFFLVRVFQIALGAVMEAIGPMQCTKMLYVRSKSYPHHTHGWQFGLCSFQQLTSGKSMCWCVVLEADKTKFDCIQVDCIP